MRIAVVGFLNGVAISILLGQIGKLFGLSRERGFLIGRIRRALIDTLVLGNNHRANRCAQAKGKGSEESGLSHGADGIKGASCRAGPAPGRVPPRGAPE